MNALLIRVGADQSDGGGKWNGPVDSQTMEFAYVPIPESRRVHPGLERPYLQLQRVLNRFDVSLPVHLSDCHMHLDPDFEKLSYGDQGERAKQIAYHLGKGDLIVFYAALADARGPARPLIYALIGIMEVETLVRARDVRKADRAISAHSRRILKKDAEDLIVLGRLGASGRLARCLPVGEYRDGAYRMKHNLLTKWGGLSVKDGYLQRSARLPCFTDPRRFRRWLDAQKPELVQLNN